MNSGTSPALQRALSDLGRVTAQRDLAVEGVHVRLADGSTWAQRWAPDTRRDVYSVSKTITGLGVGIAADEGLLTLDDPVLTHLPELADTAADGAEAITLRHLLAMTAGIDYRWADPDVDHPGDAARDFLATAPGAAPGSAYLYRGTNTYLLGRVIHACSGEDLRDYLVPRLFHPLGLRNVQWHRCPLGFPIGATGVFLRTEEVGRLAELLLGEGTFRGRRVVPAGHVRAMREETTDTARAEPDNRTYGLGAWRCARDDAWRMDGIYGQLGVVLPTLGACVSVTAQYEGPTTDILDAVWAEIVPHLPR